MPREITRNRVTVDPGTRSRTKQANKAETNINLMVSRYKKTGMFQNLNPREPKYGDFSEAVSLEEAFQAVKNAERSFMQLPAQVRALAQNSPVVLLEMLADEGATEALIQAGMPVLTKPQEGENTAPENVAVPSGGGVS